MENVYNFTSAGSQTEMCIPIRQQRFKNTFMKNLVFTSSSRRKKKPVIFSAEPILANVFYFNLSTMYQQLFFRTIFFLFKYCFVCFSIEYYMTSNILFAFRSCMWSINVAIIMLISNLTAISNDKYSIKTRSLCPTVLTLDWERLGLPELIATTSLGHSDTMAHIAFELTHCC